MTQEMAFGIDPDRPVLIAGPTASGKSELAARIVADGGGVIVNADALQVYGNWRLLTARPSVEDEAALPHALYGHVGREDDYSVGHWLREVAALLDKGIRPVIVGGTGLYFSALTEGLAEIPATPADIRTEGNALTLEELLATLDAPTAARIDRQNRARVQRAWEVLRATGEGLSLWQARTGPPVLPLARTTPLVLRPDPAWLGHRIDTRFDLMMESGALDEARAELPHWQPDRPSSRAIGAPELIAHLEGRLSLPEAIAQAKTASRQYAKRQRTWFRSRMADWTEYPLG
ncbi:tRNA (adenosine(37)-N6)-dimethylallyltransferase MiaA [Falsirhodobacter sp. alg1]|uniref:tRNA (adenosine(37)-N6)-dimethylallyltransferase MiaA n=1 Tax=Falsirhodobacter sp. alg1 TaxID=1472418 RepID=UPI0009EA95AC|nr:tRNA (adenosine(37)-N6)-dimethylallyltransferase MiaA [Falsirhodobacter sp. alg1]